MNISFSLTLNNVHYFGALCDISISLYILLIKSKKSMFSSHYAYVGGLRTFLFIYGKVIGSCGFQVLTSSVPWDMALSSLYQLEDDPYTFCSLLSALPSLPLSTKSVFYTQSIGIIILLLGRKTWQLLE